MINYGGLNYSDDYAERLFADTIYSRSHNFHQGQDLRELGRLAYENDWKLKTNNTGDIIGINDRIRPNSYVKNGKVIAKDRIIDPLSEVAKDKAKEVGKEVEKQAEKAAEEAWYKRAMKNKYVKYGLPIAAVGAGAGAYAYSRSRKKKANEDEYYD